MITKKSPVFNFIFTTPLYEVIIKNIFCDFSLHYPKMITKMATNLEKSRNGINGLKIKYLVILI